MSFTGPDAAACPLVCIVVYSVFCVAGYRKDTSASLRRYIGQMGKPVIDSELVILWKNILKG